MAYKKLTFEKKDNIGYITLSGLVVDMQLAYELADVCHQVNNDDDVWVLLLSGLGKDFCLGTSEADTDAAIVAETASNALGGVLKPVVAVLNGDAKGVGLELALAADIRLAAEGAVFDLPQVSAGAIPSGGGTQRLPRIVGKGKALQMILTAETIDAVEAWRVGLVNKVFPSGELMARAQEMVQKIVAKGPIAERYSKEAIGKGLDMTLAQGLKLEADLSFLLQTTTDRDEGIRAFMDKRTPEFKGE